MTTNLLIFFAIPLAIVIISIALQKVLRNPFLVSAIVFSILLVIVLAFFDIIYLIAVVVYSILAFISALLACILCRFVRNLICNNCEDTEDNNSNSDTQCPNSTLYTIEGNMKNVIETENCNNLTGFSGKTGSYSRNCYRRR